MFFANHFAGNFGSLPQTHWYPAPFGNFPPPSHHHHHAPSGMFADLRTQEQVPGWHSVVLNQQYAGPTVPLLNPADRAASSHAFISRQNNPATNDFNWTEMHMVNNTDSIALDPYGEEERREKEKEQDKQAKAQNAEKRKKKQCDKRAAKKPNNHGGNNGGWSGSDSDSDGPPGGDGDGRSASGARGSGAGTASATAGRGGVGGDGQGGVGGD